MNLFYLYGGYFGKIKRDNFSLETILDSIGNEIPIEFDHLDTINQKVMHVALLHGLEPSEFNEILKSYMETS